MLDVCSASSPSRFGRVAWGVARGFGVRSEGETAEHSASRERASRRVPIKDGRFADRMTSVVRGSTIPGAQRPMVAMESGWELLGSAESAWRRAMVMASLMAETAGRVYGGLAPVAVDPLECRTATLTEVPPMSIPSDEFCGAVLNR